MNRLVEWIGKDRVRVQDVFAAIGRAHAVEDELRLQLIDFALANDMAVIGCQPCVGSALLYNDCVRDQVL